METRIASLSARLEILQQQREAQRRHWSHCARLAFPVVVLLALLTMASALFLGLVFQRAASTAAPSAS